MKTQFKAFQFLNISFKVTEVKFRFAASGERLFDQVEHSLDSALNQWLNANVELWLKTKSTQSSETDHEILESG